MVDRNGNGIPDDQERNARKGADPGLKNLSVFSGRKPNETYRPGTAYGAGQQGLPGMAGLLMGLGEDYQRQGMNFVGEIPGFFTGQQQPGQGQGWGDSVLGSSPFQRPNQLGRNTSRRSLKGGISRGGQEMQETSLPDLQSFLAQAMELLGGGDELPTVSYDPLRNDARGRSAEYDARLSAMYNQLQNSMREDGTQLQGSYQTAIDDTAQRAAESQANIQGAGDAANERNMQQLQALGIGEAAGNAVSEGRDLNTQLAGAVQEAAARGQISGDALQQNQQSAAQANNSLVGAAGLEGNLQRARVQDELSQLLSQYDMQEQEANQQVAAQNAQSRQGRMSQGLNLAQALYGSEWDKINYNDQTAQSIMEMQQQANQPNKLNQSMQFLEQLMGSPQFADQDLEAILPYIQALGGIGKLV